MGRRPQFRDILSTMDFKLMADVYFGKLPNPDEYGELTKLTRSIIPYLQDGTIIFVDTWQIEEFVKDMLPLIHIRFVLISGDTDMSNPNPDAWKKKPSNDPRLIHWFMQNYNRSNSDLNSELSTALMLGNSQWNQQKETLIKLLDQGYGLKNGMAFNPL